MRSAGDAGAEERMRRGGAGAVAEATRYFKATASVYGLALRLR